VNSQKPFVDVVSDSIGDILVKGRQSLDSIGTDADLLGSVAESFMGGGKRFRAKLAYWGWRAAITSGDAFADTDGSAHNGIVVRLAAGLELFHAAALVHDDVIDNSDTRRGIPAAHRQFEKIHVDRDFVGDSAIYGTSSAILLGDLLLAWADDQFLSVALDVAPESRDAFKDELRAMRTDVTAGQFLDNHDSSAWLTLDGEVAVDRAQRVVMYKAAKYSVEAPLVLGSIVGNATPSFIASLRLFALPLGFAFQMRDDMLGVFGDEAETGKPAGDDLREGKRTVLVAMARRRGDRSTVSVFDELIGDPTLTNQQVDMLRASLISTGAADELEDLIELSRVEALTALDAMRLDSIVDGELRAMVDAITTRTV
jgi:geranylgeranyl diphosphate synthase, type I